MNKSRAINRGVLALFGILAFVLICLGIQELISLQPVLVEISIDPTAVLDEQNAIDITQEALTKAGLASPELMPVRYHPDGRIFARNIYDPNSGYVIWRWQDDRNPGYTVQLERDGPTVKCEIGLNKS